MIRVKTREDYLLYVRNYILLEPIKVCVELGCYRGDFSELILNIINPNRLHLIDTFETGEKRYGEAMNNLPVSYSTEQDYEFIKNRFSEEINDVVVCLWKHYSNYSVKLFGDGMIDFIYHDASHLYEDVKSELIEWLPKLKPTGLMCGHDYIQHPDFGVIQAVDEFCKEYNFEMIIFNENGGDYALRRK